MQFGAPHAAVLTGSEYDKVTTRWNLYIGQCPLGGLGLAIRKVKAGGRGRISTWVVNFDPIRSVTILVERGSVVVCNEFSDHEIRKEGIWS